MSIELIFEHIVISMKLAWFKTKEILFSPFKFKTYLLYGLISWLAFGTINIGFVNSFPPISQDGRLKIPSGPELFTIIAIFIAAIIAFIVISILFLWLNSHAQFLLIDSVLKNKIGIKEYWSSKRQKGQNLFGWLFVVSFCMYLPILIELAAIVGFVFWFIKNGGAAKFLEGIGAFGIVAIILFFIVLTLIQYIIFIFLSFLISLVANIIVPSMSKMDNTVKIGNALKMLFPLIKKEWLAILIYIISVYLIACAIAMVIAIVVSCIFFPFVIITLIANLILQKAPLLMIIFAMFSILIIGNIIFFLVMSALYPTLGIFITVFKLSFIGKIFPEYKTITPVLGKYQQVIGYETTYDIQEETVTEESA